METLHASRIKVLRERQDRQLATIAARMEGEVSQLETAHEEAYEKMLADHETQTAMLAKALEAKKQRLQTRLAVAELIRKKREDGHDGIVDRLSGMSIHEL